MEEEFDELRELFLDGIITIEEYVDRYNAMIEEESERERHPFEPHEHI
ncbi:MAG: hypothetical protein LUF92_17215 [Clostridiales bacterium]|nr:hypothetical protein [Clostridiales bacterium]